MKSILTVVLLATLALAGWSGSGNQVRAAEKDKLANGQWAVLARTDFNGDRQDDTVLGEKTSYPGAYRRIMVRGSSGEILLDISDEALYWKVTVAPGPFPILVVGAADGNWLAVEAFMYSSQTNKMERLKWDQRGHVRGREIQVSPHTGDISMWTESGTVSYHFQDGELKKRR